MCGSPDTMAYRSATVLICVLSLCLAASIRKGKLMTELKYEECDHPTAIHLQNLSVSPLPIPMPGSVGVSLQANVTQIIPNNIDLKVTIRKWQNHKWQRLPCVADSFGSCKYRNIPTCVVFEQILACPMEQKFYNLTYTLDFADPGNLARAFLKGNYRATVKARHPVTRQLLLCIRGQFSLTSNEQNVWY